MEKSDKISSLGSFTFCSNILPFVGYTDQCYCLMRSLNSECYKVWKKYEVYLISDVLRKRKLDRIYSLLKVKDEEKLVNVFKLFKIYVHLKDEADCLKMIQIIAKVKHVEIYGAIIENYGDTSDLMAKILGYHEILLRGVRIKDIRVPVRVVSDFKKQGAALKEILPSTLSNLALETPTCDCKTKCACITPDRYTWEVISLNISNMLKFWSSSVIQAYWFKICYPRTPRGLISKEYSPGRYRYFILPVLPMMTVECDRNNYMSITVQKFTYKWGDLFTLNLEQAINHFKIELRGKGSKYCQFEFGLQKFYPIYEDAKVEVESDEGEEESSLKEGKGATGSIYVVGVRKKRVYKYTFEELRVQVEDSEEGVEENIFESFKGMIQVKKVKELEVKGLKLMKYDMKMEKDLLDFWNYDPHVIEDLFFIDCGYQDEKFALRYSSESLYKEISIQKPTLTLTLHNIFDPSVTSIPYNKVNMEIDCTGDNIFKDKISCNYSIFNSISLKIDTFDDNQNISKWFPKAALEKILAARLSELHVSCILSEHRLNLLMTLLQDNLPRKPILNKLVFGCRKGTSLDLLDETCRMLPSLSDISIYRSNYPLPNLSRYFDCKNIDVIGKFERMTTVSHIKT